MGCVFLAECLDHEEGSPDTPPGWVALKALLALRAEEAPGLVRRELSSLLAFQHDRVPRIYDWSLHPDRPFVAMHYYPMGNLDAPLRRGEVLEEESAWRLLEDLLSALRAAHRASILHLDIKPANVLLDGRGGYVLADFGLSQGALVSDSIVSTSLGTVGYQAPEQFRLEHDAFDARTDLWSLGATVWSVLAGELLFKRQELLLYVEGSEHYGLPPLTGYRSDLSPELQGVVMTLVASRPTERPGSAAEVLLRVQQAKDRQAGRAAPSILSDLGMRVDPGDVEDLLESLVDPLWVSLLRNPGSHPFLCRFKEGDCLCREGERAYDTFILLRGTVNIEREGKRLAAEKREGTFLGEVAALTGAERTASVRATGLVFCLRFNPAQLERFVSVEPALAIRLIKLLAERVARESGRSE